LIRITELLDPNVPRDLWPLLKQVGVDEIVSLLDEGEQAIRWVHSESHLDERPASAQLRELLDAIAERKLNANVSLKLTHMGLDVDEKLSRDIVDQLVAHAAKLQSFVRVDMEGSPYTDKTLQVVRDLHRRDGNAGRVGAVIQAYLHRSETDADSLCAERIRIRLCKGAYKEPPEIAFQKKSEVDANYVKLMKILMKSRIYHGLATHDQKIINQAKAFATK